MSVTEFLGLELPEETTFVSEEFQKLQLLVLPKIDHAIRLLSEALSQKASLNHPHEIDGIEGLRNALDNKMAANRRFALSDLLDVEGIAEAANGYILVKVGEKMIAQSALAALGDHEHPISKVRGLEDALDVKLDADQIWTGSQAAYDALPDKIATTLYFIT